MAKEEKKGKPAKVKRPQALKRDDQNEKSRLRNKAFKTNIRTTIRNFEEALTAGDAANIKEHLNNVYSIMDKGVKRGVVKLNKASRVKARLTARTVATA